MCTGKEHIHVLRVIFFPCTLQRRARPLDYAEIGGFKPAIKLLSSVSSIIFMFFCNTYNCLWSTCVWAIHGPWSTSMVCFVPFMAYGLWSASMVCFVPSVVYGLWSMVSLYGLFCSVCGLWPMVYVLWSMVSLYGLFCSVCGLWPMVYGLWSMSYGLWSATMPHRAEQPSQLHQTGPLCSSTIKVSLVIWLWLTTHSIKHCLSTDSLPRELHQ